MQATHSAVQAPVVGSGPCRRWSWWGQPLSHPDFLLEDEAIAVLPEEQDDTAVANWSCSSEGTVKWRDSRGSSCGTVSLGIEREEE